MPQKVSTPYTVICAYCGTSFSPHPPRPGRDRFCSKSCRSRMPKGVRNTPTSERFAARFWERVAQSDACWEWQGGRNGEGYGRVRFNERSDNAHRVAWQLVNGPIPVGMMVCHTCDNPPCCNPDHLFLGTDADNTHDMIAKGRKALGGRNGVSKLTEDDVRFIRALYDGGERNRRILASRFNVSEPTIGTIVTRRSWKHVQ